MSVTRSALAVVLGVASPALTSCERRDPPPRMVSFGPPEAEAEIRSAFDIQGEMPRIRDLIQFANARRINHETEINDRSLTYCDIGRDMASLSVDIFYVRMDRARRTAYNYAVVYDRNGQIVCIETKHQYTSY